MAKNVEMTVKQADGSYETIYPKTLVENISDIGDSYYNKNQILSSTTAQQYGLPSDAIPDQVLSLLSRFNGGLGNEYLWERTINTYIENQIINQTVQVYYSNNRTPESQTITLYDSISVDPISGEISGNNPIEFSGNYNRFNNQHSQLVGKYYKSSPQTDSSNDYDWYFISSSATWHSGNGGPNPWYCLFNNAIAVTSILKIEPNGYVNSPNIDAYPPSVSDGYTYEALGKIGARKYIVGAYNGNNTGSRFINLGVTPKAVLVENNLGGRASYGATAYMYATGALAVTGANAVWVDNYNQTFNILTIEDGGFNVYYKNSSSGASRGAYTNFNEYTYIYIAFI